MGFLSPPTKLGGDMKIMSVCPSMRPCICPGFPPIIWKNDLKFGVCICWVSVQNWFTFGWCWPNFGPPVPQKRLLKNRSKWWFPTIIWKSIHTIQFKLVVYTCLVCVQNWFAFGWRWLDFGPLVAKNDWKWCFNSDHYLKKYSCNPIQTWCVHLSGDYFLTMLAKFWSSNGTKMT